MRKLGKYLLGLLLFSLLSIFFAAIWSRNPEFFPFLNFSQDTWTRIIELTGYNKIDLEIVASLVFGALMTTVVLAAIRVIHFVFQHLPRRSR